MKPNLATALFNRPVAIDLRQAARLSDLAQIKSGQVTDADVATILANYIREKTDAYKAYITAAGDVSRAAWDDDLHSSQMTGKAIAVIPIFGTMYQHAWYMKSTEQIGAEVRRAAADDSIGAILLEIHSPGGEVYGIEELSETIFAARDAKRIVAQVNSMCASAALWTGTAADEIVITPGGEMGSIGVLTIHTNVSKYEERLGFETTLIALPAKKIDGNCYEPLSDTARAEIDRQNKVFYDKFTADVARNRGVSTSKVEKDFGGGGMLLADEATSAGLADSIGTMHSTIESLFNDLSGQSGHNYGAQTMTLRQGKKKTNEDDEETTAAEDDELRDDTEGEEDDEETTAEDDDENGVSSSDDEENLENSDAEDDEEETTSEGDEDDPEAMDDEDVDAEDDEEETTAEDDEETEAEDEDDDSYAEDDEDETAAEDEDETAAEDEDEEVSSSEEEENSDAEDDDEETTAEDEEPQSKKKGKKKGSDLLMRARARMARLRMQM